MRLGPLRYDLLNVCKTGDVFNSQRLEHVIIYPGRRPGPPAMPL